MPFRCGSAKSKSAACCAIVLRGPAGKIHTTLSLKPLGWHDGQDPQPLLDIRPMMGGAPGDGGSNFLPRYCKAPSQRERQPREFRVPAAGLNASWRLPFPDHPLMQ